MNASQHKASLSVSEARRNHKQSLLVALIIFITTLLLSFYWYEVRPSQAIKYCQSWSIEKTESIDGGDREDAIYYYKKCLREKGFDK